MFGQFDYEYNNGFSSPIVLPGAPSYDKTEYPYCFIYFYELVQAYIFFAVNKQGQLYADEKGFLDYKCSESFKYKSWLIFKKNPEWSNEYGEIFYNIVIEQRPWLNNTSWGSFNESSHPNLKKYSLSCELKDICWVSFDLVVQNGEIEQIKSYPPLKKFSLEEFCAGVAIGISSGPSSVFESFKKKMPEIPSYDTNAFPYEIIGYSKGIFSNTPVAIISNVPFYFKERKLYFDTKNENGQEVDQIRFCYVFLLGRDDKWTSIQTIEIGVEEKDRRVIYMGRLIYSNEQILSQEKNENGIPLYHFSNMIKPTVY